MARRPHAKEISGYLELHIEQGPRLAQEGMELGVVSAIVAIRRCQVRVVGEANHAGTTPMANRQDAGQATFRSLSGLPELLRAIDPEMVGNVGHLEVRPGAANVIPGETVFTLELRSARPASLDAAMAAFESQLAEGCRQEGCRFLITPPVTHPGATMDPRLVATLERVCQRLGHRWRRLDSGAGHDAASLAAVVPAGMLFVPSTGGISHSPAENTSTDLLTIGAQALLEGTLEALDVLDVQTTVPDGMPEHR